MPEYQWMYRLVKRYIDIFILQFHCRVIEGDALSRHPLFIIRYDKEGINLIILNDSHFNHSWNKSRKLSIYPEEWNITPPFDQVADALMVYHQPTQ